MPRALTVLLVLLLYIANNYAENPSDKKQSNHEMILSRKRRYLAFPQGSSIQLVYCFTIPIYANCVFATTAALAWMLPTSDDILPESFLKKNNTERVDTVKIIYQKQILKKPTQYALISSGYYKNPMNYRVHYMQFPQPVRYQTVSLSPSFKDSYNRGRFYPSSTWRNSYYDTRHTPITTYVNPIHNELHRRSRRHLFGKIEKFFTANYAGALQGVINKDDIVYRQRKDGKACLLKAVCEVSQTADGEKGTFVQEIIKAIFRIHPSHIGEEDTYDIAAKVQSNCSELYPKCDFSLWEAF